VAPTERSAGIVRPAVGWDASKNLTVLVGYASISQVGESTGDQLLGDTMVHAVSTNLFLTL
jgi:hypothetical protein